MRKLIVAVLLLVGVLALALFSLRSERNLVALGHWAVARFTPYRMVLVNPELRLTSDSWSAAEIHLYPADEAGPPFLSILDFRGHIRLVDLLRGSLQHSDLRASQLVIYVSATDTTEDPDPVQWLEIAAWLPATLELDQVHLVTTRQETLVFPLQELRGERVGPNQFHASTRAQYDGEPLTMETTFSALRLDGGRGTASLQARVLAPGSGSRIDLDGALEGTGTDFQYHFELDANYTDINEFLRGLEDQPGLDGRLSVGAAMHGDVSGFRLSDARFTLDNMPHYGIEAAGTLNYDYARGGELNLVAAGEVSSMDVVLEWLDIDLRSLGRAQGSATVVGTLERPIVEDFLLRSESDTGLVAKVSGRIDPSMLHATDNQLRLDLLGPSLATLSAWTGELSFEPGPFTASAHLHARSGTVALEDMIVEVGHKSRGWARLQGSADNVVAMREAGLAGAKGLNLAIRLFSPDSAYLNDLLKLPVPGGFTLEGEIELAGSGELLRPVAGQLRAHSSDIDLQLTSLQGEVRPGKTPVLENMAAKLALSMGDTSALSQLTPQVVPVLGAVEGSGQLRQTPAGFALEAIDLSVLDGQRKLSATGSVQNLAPLRGVSLDTEFSGIEISELLTGLLTDFHYEQALGTLGGRASLGYRESRWDLSAVDAATEEQGGRLELTLTASAEDLTGIPAVDSELHYHVRDPALLEALTGLRMNPTRGSLTTTSRPGQLYLDNDSTTGETRIDLNARLSHSSDAVTGLELAVHSPSLLLDDLGLQASGSIDDAYSPSDRLEDLEPGVRLEKLLAASPRYPLTLAFRADGIRGQNTLINSLDIQLTGENNRYTLRRFNVGYADTTGEARGIIDLNASPPFVSLAGEAVAIPLNTLGKDLGLNSEVSGQLTLRGGLSAQGSSGPALLEDVDGSLAVALENAVFEGAAYDLLATDLLAWIYTGAAQQASTRVDCTMARFQLEDGVATSDDLYIETRQMVASGQAELDFVKQTMDISITPRSKTRALQVPSSVRIQGPFDAPRTSLSPVAAAFDAYAELLSLVPRLTRKLFGVKRRESARRPCEARQ